MAKPRVGKIVMVKRTIYFHYDENNQRTYSFHESNKLLPKKCFLIGIRYCPLGKYQRGYQGSWGYDADPGEPPSLDCKGVVKVALVVESIHNAPMRVLYSDIEDQLS